VAVEAYYFIGTNNW